MTYRDVYVDGAGIIANRDVAYDLMDTIRAFRGQHVDITVERHVDTRSQRANAYLWGHVYAAMAAHTGHTAEDLHAVMVERFLPSDPKRLDFFNALTGDTYSVRIDRRHSSKLTGSAFYDFVETVRQFAAEFLGVETEDPDKEYWRAKVARAE